MYHNRSNILAILLVAVTTVLSAQAFALATDRAKPMNIRANSVDIDEQGGRSVYRGKVVVIQGSMRITAETLTVIYDKDQKVKKIIAEGNPTTYKQRPDNKPHDVEAIAKKLVFFAPQNMLVLTNNARIVQGGNQFKSKKIFYNMKLDEVRAGKTYKQKARGSKPAVEEKNRVNIVLDTPAKPKKKKSKKKNR